MGHAHLDTGLQTCVAVPGTRLACKTLRQDEGHVAAQMAHCRSELVSNISSAALFRCIEAYRPTLLLDEGETYLRDNEAMRSILNSGHTQSEPA